MHRVRNAEYDVLVIGGGHAGAEAAWAAARLGARTGLLTFDRAAIGRMSCNPAIGGIGKGQMVREIDALGGLMGIVADRTGIQFRMLNRSKGPAVWAPRCQSDRELYAAAVREHLENCPNLTLIEAGVESIDAEPAGRVPLLCEQWSAANGPTTPQNASASPHGNRKPAGEAEAAGGRSGPRPAWRITGLTLSDGRRIAAGAVIVTSGTFLRGLMHCGEQKTAGGRVGEAAATGLSASLERLGLALGRLKTGTPPRLRRETIDFDRLALQPGDEPPMPFSYMTDRIDQPQIPCWITWTNPAVHELIRTNLHRAPMYSGQIESRGPRYCPSIEDKVVRFADKEKHQIFLEPEGRDSDRIYVNGISTSLPAEVQERIVHSIEGLERAEILQWGYAVEYDFVPPEQIDASLMTKCVDGLFLAGQINGTSGYEEAAAQGIVAGINAARRAAAGTSGNGGWAPVILRRDQAYIGVMIDDLVTRGVTEPYRMFTSRAEHRLLLRYDNADARLTPLGREVGLVDDARWRRFEEREARLAEVLHLLSTTRHEGRTLRDWLKRPDEDGSRFFAANGNGPGIQPDGDGGSGVPFSGAAGGSAAGNGGNGAAGFAPDSLHSALGSDLWARALVEVKYEGYIERERRVIQRLAELEFREIPAGLEYAGIPHLRREAVERWSAIRPRNVGQAGRVSGVTPADVSLLLIHLHARGDGQKQLA